MTVIDYEAEYNNRALVPEHPSLIEGWRRDAAAFRNEATAELDISYELSPRAAYDLFLPSGGLPARGVIALFLHGGYWQALDRSFFSHMARGPVAHGIPTVIGNYDLCPDVRIGDITEEIRRLIAHLWDRYRKPVVVYGHSAGGHLTAEMLATDWRQRGLPPRLVPAGLAISGLFDLQPLVSTSLNANLRLDRQEAIAVSPIARIAPAGTALIAAVGGDESSEFLRQSRIIADIWGRGGVDTTLDIRPGENHFTVIAPLADPDSDLTAALVAQARKVC